MQDRSEFLRRLERDLRWGLSMGLMAACFYSILGGGLVLLRGGTAYGLTVIQLVGLYLAGGLFGGVLLGALRRCVVSAVGGWLVATLVCLPFCVLVTGAMFGFGRKGLVGGLVSAVIMGAIGARVFVWDRG